MLFEDLTMSILGFFLLLIIVFLVYICGYAVGLYSVSCHLDSSQPQCVKAGWNGGTVHLEKK